MGGLHITPKAEVLTVDEQVIPGLYAAGEVAGHKMGTNRLGSCSMTDIYTFVLGKRSVTKLAGRPSRDAPLCPVRYSGTHLADGLPHVQERGAAPPVSASPVRVPVSFRAGGGRLRGSFLGKEGARWKTPL